MHISQSIACLANRVSSVLNVARFAHEARQRTLGKQGTAPGEFRKPTAITACRRGADAFLIVGEFTGRRVQILSLFGAPLQLLTLAPAVGPVRVGPFCVQGDRVYATASAPGPPLLVFDLKK